MTKVEIGSSTLYCGDCLEILPSLGKELVDMVFADLPYGITEQEWDVPIPLDKLWLELNRVCTETAAQVFTATQPFSARLVSSNYDGFRYEWIWNKKHPTGFQIVAHRPLSLHESVLVFCRGSLFKIKYRPVRIPFKKPQHRSYRAPKNKLWHPLWRDNFKENVHYSRCPTSILEICRPTAVNEEIRTHPTQKPVELLNYFIQTYTGVNDLVLDPVMGSGTTVVSALLLGRKAIGIEKNQEFFDSACNRIQKMYNDMLQAKRQDENLMEFFGDVVN